MANQFVPTNQMASRSSVNKSTDEVPRLDLVTNNEDSNEIIKNEFTSLFNSIKSGVQTGVKTAVKAGKKVTTNSKNLDARSY